MSPMSHPSADLDTARPGRRRWPWVAAGVAVLLVVVGGGGYLFRQHQEQVDDDDARALATQVASAVAAGDVSALPVAGPGAAALQKDTAAALKGLGTSTATATVQS